jgi:hypothetical protein
MGIAGASLSNRTILITGFAGLVAGASWMANRQRRRAGTDAVAGDHRSARLAR